MKSVSDTDMTFQKLVRCLTPFLFFVIVSGPSTPYAAETAPQDTLRMTRADLLLRTGKPSQAIEELDRLPKEAYEKPSVHRALAKTFEKLYAARRRPQRSFGKPPRRKFHAEDRVRVTRRRADASRNSDQSFDERGWQVNERFVGDVEVRPGVRGHFVIDVDGFRDGHNDLRYRTVLADLTQGSSHLAAGDSATFTSPYFLRGSRLRGLNLLLTGDTNEFQAVAGGYPVWLTDRDRDQYVFPRTVFGLRDRKRFLEDRFRLGASFVNTRDTGKIRSIDPANQTRDNTVVSIDQEVKLIPDVWFLKAAQAYAITDDNLEEDRFGNNAKLKDTSLMVESLFIQPLFQWRGRLERTGPDFRLLTAIPSGTVENLKGLTSDRQLIEQGLDLAPLGPFDLDLQASWIRNDLNDNDSIEHTRQAWYTANLGMETPKTWPRPRLRGTFIRTVSSPGSTTRPQQTGTWDVTGELYRKFWTVDSTAFASYRVELPLKERSLFEEEESWVWGFRLAQPVGDRALVNGRYKYLFLDQPFDEERSQVSRHEINLGGSVRLWSTANLGLSYTHLSGNLIAQSSTRLAGSTGDALTLDFTWPYVLYTWDRRRKFTFSPALAYHITSLARGLGEHPLTAGRLSVGYEAAPDWRLELVGEYRWERDLEANEVRAQDSRMWLLWTSRWK